MGFPSDSGLREKDCGCQQQESSANKPLNDIRYVGNRCGCIYVPINVKKLESKERVPDECPTPVEPEDLKVSIIRDKKRGLNVVSMNREAWITLLHLFSSMQTANWGIYPMIDKRACSFSLVTDDHIGELIRELRKQLIHNDHVELSTLIHGEGEDER